jgi:hypothetical protein
MVAHLPEQGFCKLIDTLASLVRQFSEARFDLRVDHEVVVG